MPSIAGRGAPLLAAAMAAMLIAASPLAAQKGLEQATQLYKQGQPEQALATLRSYLAERPNDAHGRFLMGLVLAEQNRVDESIQVFTALTRDFPDLPEPYNNLAVLYASRGDYERARAALETAIRTHPSYATAHENLGDIYAKMASRAYDTALQLDRSNAAARTKLNLIGELFSGRALEPALAEPMRPTPAPVVAAAPQPAPTASPAPTEPPARAPKPATSPARVAQDAPAQAAVETPPEASAPAPGAEAVLQTVRTWAAAWSANDTDAYLGHYAADFRTPKGEPREAWEAQRRARIAKPRRIEVSIATPRVAFDSPDQATVTFRQHYRSDTFKSSVTKTLIMIRTGGRWLIREERV